MELKEEKETKSALVSVRVFESSRKAVENLMALDNKKISEVTSVIIDDFASLQLKIKKPLFVPRTLNFSDTSMIEIDIVSESILLTISDQLGKKKITINSEDKENVLNLVANLLLFIKNT